MNQEDHNRIKKASLSLSISNLLRQVQKNPEEVYEDLRKDLISLLGQVDSISPENSEKVWEDLRKDLSSLTSQFYQNSLLRLSQVDSISTENLKKVHEDLNSHLKSLLSLSQVNSISTENSKKVYEDLSKYLRSFTSQLYEHNLLHQVYREDREDREDREVYRDMFDNFGRAQNETSQGHGLFHRRGLVFRNDDMSNYRNLLKKTLTHLMAPKISFSANRTLDIITKKLGWLKECSGSDGKYWVVNKDIGAEKTQLLNQLVSEVREEIQKNNRKVQRRVHTSYEYPKHSYEDLKQYDITMAGVDGPVQENNEIDVSDSTHCAM